jgi:hypothetical protein
MAIDNVSNPTVNFALAGTETGNPANAAALVNSLPPAALFSKEFQPLLNSIDPSQVYPFTPAPLPYAKPEAFAKFAAEPNLLLNSLKTASTGLGGFLQSLDVAGADAQVAEHLANAQAAFASGDMLTAQLEMMEAQKLQSFMSMLINMIGSMEMEAIRNSKLS